MTPILRWAGSKRYLADRLIPLFPASYERYVEPFCGSASLFFLVEPPNALLGDVNGELISAYRQLRRSGERIVRLAEALPDDRDAYNAIREAVPEDLPPLHRAARFFYLNRLCFNGLYRTNKAGAFNVPYSGRRTKSVFEAGVGSSCARLLKRAELVVGDFSKTLRRVRQGDFVYLDPPYATGSRRVFRQYSADSFGMDDLGRLSRWLAVIHARGARFMLSYADCQESRKVAGHWECRRVHVRRHIAGFSGHRRKAVELVISNY